MAMLEAENWKIALELYKGHPISALLLAHQLMAIRQCLQRGQKGIPNAVVEDKCYYPSRCRCISRVKARASIGRRENCRSRLNK
jgi:hypothetical protein